MVIQLLLATLLIKFQAVKVFEILFNDHGIALCPFLNILLSFQEVTTGKGGIREVYLFGIHLIYKKGPLCIQRLVGLLNPCSDLSDAVAGKEKENSEEYESVHSRSCMAQLI